MNSEGPHISSLYPHLLALCFFFGGPCPWHVEVPKSGNEPMPQQWKYQVLNLLHHEGIPSVTFFFFFLPFLRPLPWHMEVPRLGVELEL